MVKKMVAEPTAEGTPKASKNAMIPIDYLERCKVNSPPPPSCARPVYQLFLLSAVRLDDKLQHGCRASSL